MNTVGIRQECCRNISGMLQEYCGNAAGILHEYRANAAEILDEYCGKTRQDAARYCQTCQVHRDHINCPRCFQIFPDISIFHDAFLGKSREIVQSNIVPFHVFDLICLPVFMRHYKLQRASRSLAETGFQNATFGSLFRFVFSCMFREGTFGRFQCFQVALGGLLGAVLDIFWAPVWSPGRS